MPIESWDPVNQPPSVASPYIVNLRFRSFYFLSLYLILPWCYAQSVVPYDVAQYHSAFRHSLQRATDSTIQSQQHRVDSLSHVLATILYQHISSFQSLSDSLIGSAREILDSSRIDSLYHLHNDFSNRLNTYGRLHQQDMHVRFLQYTPDLKRLKILT